MSSIYYIILFFVFGLMFGSFFNVVGYRLPKNESIVFPPSHCPKCGKKLGMLELIPIISFIFLRGRCKGCGSKISIVYPLFELLTGFSFALCFIVFGFDIPHLVISLTLISALIIIIISDVNYMLIPDEILIACSVIIFVEEIFFQGFNSALMSVGSGVLALCLMFIIGLVGNFLFKRESLGGGDIKLMFIIGMTVGFELSLFSILIASFIALPVALVILYVKKTDIIPFGPFLSLAGMLLYFSRITPSDIYNVLLNFRFF